MNGKYKIAVFDLDGTLLDTTEGVIAAVQYAVEQENLAPLDKETLLTFIGPPVQDSFYRVFGVEGSKRQRMTDNFRNQYKEFELFKAIPYEGIYELCDALLAKGIKVAVATYKRQDYAESILKHFHFDRYSNTLYGADPENKLKKVDIIRKCMENLDETDYSNAVMIGDSIHDASGAEQIGMDFIGVTYGFDFRTKKDVMKCKAIGSADKPMEILDFF